MLLRGLSLIAASGGCSLVAGHRLLTAVAFLVEKLGSRHIGSVVEGYWLSCSVACGIVLDQESNPCALHWQVGS